ncbi:MAG: amidohydrolase family protein [Bryobacteraceae bacterium]
MMAQSGRGATVITMRVALIFLILFVPAPAAVKAVRFGKLIDGDGTSRANAVVVIDGSRIREVTTEIPAGAEVIDLSGFTGLPGLIDAHVHMTYYWDRAPGTRPFGQGGTRAPAVTVFLAQENARRTLESGVTAVRDLGASEGMSFAMRDLIERGAMQGPRLFVCGYGLSVGRSAPRPGVPIYPGQADGPGEVMRVARQQIAAGADWVKLFGSTGSGNDVSGRQTFTFDEMKAAVDAVHLLGKRVAIHSYGPAGARDAVRAGADSVEHAVDLDDDTLAEMARRKTFYVPTIDHNRYYAEHAREFGYSDADVAALQAFIKRNVATAGRAHRAGVRFAMGSDAVFTMFGENARELEWLVQAGMTTAQAITTATANGAALLGVEDRSGRIAAGYDADLIAVAGDPLTDIRALTRAVRWVMKAGNVVVDKRRQAASEVSIK